VTTVTCLFIVKNKNKNKIKKRNIKLRKIDKRKRKILVSKHTITLFGAFQYNLVCKNQSTGYGDTS